MHYRSDWPEVGLPNGLIDHRFFDASASLDRNRSWIQEVTIAGAVLRWSATPSQLESDLYGFPIWNLHLEVDDVGGNVLSGGVSSAELRGYISGMLHQLFLAPPWDAAYVAAKLVKDEPLYDALVRVGFEVVEHRRLYICRVRDLISEPFLSSVGDVRFTSLATVAPEQLASCRRQVLDISREAFEKGYSRHFTDPFLLERLPGIAYILAMMELNFRNVAPDYFLLAVDTSSDRVCGFSAIGTKRGFGESVYTQLLSAVRKTYRGQGVYGGLTYLLSQTLPQDATLLNVTHVDNLAIQRAYQDSGRVCLADTVVLRRVFHATK